jgi:hypothetical protein
MNQLVSTSAVLELKYTEESMEHPWKTLAPMDDALERIATEASEVQPEKA